MDRKYKVLHGEDLKQKLKTEGIRVFDFMDNQHCFSSPDVAVNGNLTNGWRSQNWIGSGWKGFDVFSTCDVSINNERYQEQLKKWEEMTTKLPGVKCPMCRAQGFKTDWKNVAVCGACPGWFFYYLLEYDDDESEGKIKYEIRNGELVPVQVKKNKRSRDLK